MSRYRSGTSQSDIEVIQVRPTYNEYQASFTQDSVDEGSRVTEPTADEIEDRRTRARARGDALTADYYLNIRQGEFYEVTDETKRMIYFNDGEADPYQRLLTYAVDGTMMGRKLEYLLEYVHSEW